MQRQGESPPPSLRIANGFRFGEWEVLPRENLLRRGNARRKIEPKVMRLLVLLAGRLDAPWTKEELMDELWPAADAGESSLTRAVSELRRSLDDKRSNARYIDTIQNVGYKAIAPLRPLDAATVAGAEGLRRQAPQRDGSIEALDMAAYLIARRNGSDCVAALEILHDTTEHHRGLAEAHAMIGVAERLVQLYCDRPLAVHGQRSREAAERAVELDPHCALAWGVLASLDRDAWRWQSALDRFERAMALDDDNAFILHDYAELLWNLGRLEEARATMKRCCEINPVGAGERLIHAWISLHFDEDAAWRQVTMARQLGCDAVFADNLECFLLHRAGWSQTGIERWHELNARRRDDRFWMWPRLLLEGLTGSGNGSRLVQSIRRQVVDREIDAGVAVFIFDLSGQLDEAFALAEHALEDRSLFIVDPWLSERQAFRGDRRFPELLERAGLDGRTCPWLAEAETR
ncbi:MAG: tetratricopeptide repeat protein [Gammaproteobacteria bacterium]|nr:tetratricopeptide repeat protein [Gammaproteobacteria bacterium]